jgi:drug/metabolite transporter (DMT)-like permease
LNRQKKADLLLILVTGFWGVSYFLSDLCLADMGPLTLNAFRFVVAFAFLFALLFPKMRHVSRATLKYALFVGLCLSMAYIGATCGLLYTSISNAGFICAMPVLFTPILGFIFKHQIPGKKMIAALALCIIGLGLLTLNDQFRPGKGDLICLLCAIGYAADLLVTETAVRDPQVNALQLGVYQLGTVAVVMVVLAFLFETPHLPTTTTTWAASLFLGIFCSGIAFAVTTVQQQYTSASHVGLIFTLEPLFSAIVAFFFANERLSVQGYIGAALMMSSLFFMEGDFKGWLAKRRRKTE